MKKQTLLKGSGLLLTLGLPLQLAAQVPALAVPSGIPGLSGQTLDPSRVAGFGPEMLGSPTDLIPAGGGSPSLPGLDGLPVDPTSLAGGSLPGLDGLPLDPTSLGGGGAPETLLNVSVADGQLSVAIKSAPEIVVTAAGQAVVIPPASGGSGGLPGADSLPLDPTSLAGGGGGAPSLPGMDSLPLDPTSLAGSGGGAPSLPGMDSLPLDPTSLAGSGGGAPSLPGMDSLPLDPTSLAGGGGGDSAGLPGMDSLPFDPAMVTDALPFDTAPLSEGATAFSGLVDSLTDVILAAVEVVDGDRDPMTLSDEIVGLGQDVYAAQPDLGGEAGVEPVSPLSEVPDDGAPVDAEAEVSVVVSTPADPASDVDTEAAPADSEMLPASPLPPLSSQLEPVLAQVDSAAAMGADSL